MRWRAPRGSQPSFGGEESLPHARQDRQASSVSRPLEGRQRPKKPGPSLLQVASPVWRGSPVRLRLPVFHGRLTGLLSRSPPTDTRPQARAYWAIELFVRIVVMRKGFLRPGRRISRRRHKIVKSGGIRRPGKALRGTAPARGARRRRNVLGGARRRARTTAPNDPGPISAASWRLATRGARIV
jgi:hypothetical protein